MSGYQYPAMDAPASVSVEKASRKLQRIYLPWIAIAQVEDMMPWVITLNNGEMIELSCPLGCAVEIEEKGWNIKAKPLEEI